MTQKYPLESLLRVRHYREDVAKKAVSQAKQAVQEAEQALVFAKRKVEAYRSWRLNEEDRRYAKIIGTTCTIEEINSLKQGIAHLMLQELCLEEAVKKAKQDSIKKEKELESAKEKLVEVQKDIMKLCTHKDIWTVEAQKEIARAEDLEMEEFTPKNLNEFE